MGLALFIFVTACFLFLISQAMGLWQPGRAARVYAWAKILAALPLVGFGASLWAVFSDDSKAGGVRGIAEGSAFLCLLIFVAAILNLILCAVLAGQEAVRLSRASHDRIPALGLNSAEERRSETP